MAFPRLYSSEICSSDCNATDTCAQETVAFEKSNVPTISSPSL